MYLDIMRYHLRTDEEPIASRNAKIGSAVCPTTELTCMEATRCTKAESHCALDGSFGKFLEPGEKISCRIRLAKSMLWMKPTDGNVPKFERLQIGYVAHDARNLVAEK